MLVVDDRRPVREIARELDVNHETLRNWVAALRRNGPRSAGVSGLARAVHSTRASTHGEAAGPRPVTRRVSSTASANVSVCLGAGSDLGRLAQDLMRHSDVAAPQRKRKGKETTPSISNV